MPLDHQAMLCQCPTHQTYRTVFGRRLSWVNRTGLPRPLAHGSRVLTLARNSATRCAHNTTENGASKTPARQVHLHKHALELLATLIMRDDAAARGGDVVRRRTDEEEAVSEDALRVVYGDDAVADALVAHRAAAHKVSAGQQTRQREGDGDERAADVTHIRPSVILTRRSSRSTSSTSC